MNQKPLQWHPAFCSALQIELEGEDLQFQFEHNLTRKPLQIDALIIHKTSGATIRKSIGRIFRTHNIVEYKSPEDYLSIEDYNKVLGYACIYQSNTKKTLDIRPEEITITFVSNRYPRKMIQYLKKLYEKNHFLVQQMYPGIYYLKGLPFPTQILVTKQLSPEETLWLSRLRSDLKAESDRDILLNAYMGKDQLPSYTTLMDVLVRANKNCFKEDDEMCDALMELMEGRLQEWQTRGLQQGLSQGLSLGLSQGRCSLLIEQICKKLPQQKSVTDIANDLAVNLEEIEPLYNIAKSFAPDYPIESIYQKWQELQSCNDKTTEIL